MGTSNETQEQVVVEWHGSLAIIRLGSEEERIAILTSTRMESLAEAIEEVRKKSGVRGLVITGASISGFCAGADINVINSVAEPAAGQQLAERGQEIFGILASCPFTTVAAVSGACVGGGCELALACDYRVLLDRSDTKIGLPEIKLGILPGFGGTQRLPRLVGLRQALDVILQGRVLPAGRALRMGLADKLVPADAEQPDNDAPALEKTASDIALGKLTVSRKKLGIVDRALTYTQFGRGFVRSRARAGVMKSTKGHYPAPPRALDVTVGGLAGDLAVGLREEAKALGELIVTPECKSLVHLYFLTENASKLGRAAQVEVEHADVAVVGGGVMGAGIAACFIGQGIPGVLIEPIEEARKKAAARVKGSLEKRRSLSEEEKREYLGRLKITEDLKAAGRATVVIEAIIEDLEVKKELFLEVEQIVTDKTILASNTSSLSIRTLAQSLSDAGRVIGMHFFNPAEKMPLVEVVRGENTSERSVAYVSALIAKLGKYPVVVDDVPGFLVNRILSPYIAEAATLLSQGLSIDQIDKAALKFGMPMGPIRLLDEVGLDVVQKVKQIMTSAYGARMDSPDVLTALVSGGRLGKKSGRGFYQYDNGDEQVDEEVYSLIERSSVSSDSVRAAQIQDRLILSLVNEAVRCLDEGVAGVPGGEAAGQIDLATVMGMGFAPFRGGVLRYAESLGSAEVKKRLEAVAEQQGERFVPCEGIVRRAEEGKSFYEAL